MPGYLERKAREEDTGTVTSPLSNKKQTTVTRHLNYCRFFRLCDDDDVLLRLKLTIFDKPLQNVI